MIIIFCGLPGSGKSTLARELQKELKKLGKSCKLFVSDEIPGRIYKKIPQILKQNLGEIDFVILDATFYKKKWRDLVHRLAKGEKVLTFYIHCSLKTCLKRNRARKPFIPERAIHIIHHEIEKPKLPDLSINTEKIKVHPAMLKILKKLKLKKNKSN